MMPEMTEMMWVWSVVGVLLVVLLIILIARLLGK